MILYVVLMLFYIYVKMSYKIMEMNHVMVYDQLFYQFFLNKISIALKEARETKYWFDLLVKSETYTISELKCTRLLEEIISILTKIKKW